MMAAHGTKFDLKVERVWPFELSLSLRDMRLYSTLFLGLFLLASCNPGGESPEGASSTPCANGFAPTGNPVSMGSESAVDLYFI